MEPFKEGKKYRFQDLEFYACNGAIRIHDTRNGEQRDVMLTEFFDRAKALYEAVPHYQYYDEKREAVRMAQNVELACEEAAAMGDPFDPEVQHYRRVHKTYKQAWAAVESETAGVGRRPSGLLVANG